MSKMFSYFPGCTLKNKARDLDRYARAAAERLGLALEEIPEWQCCGGVYPLTKDEIAVRLASIRALAQSAKDGRPLVTVCSACHNVIKQVNHDMQTDAHIIESANNYLRAEGLEVLTRSKRQSSSRSRTASSARITAACCCVLRT